MLMEAWPPSHNSVGGRRKNNVPYPDAGVPWVLALMGLRLVGGTGFIRNEYTGRYTSTPEVRRETGLG